jgi:hypothetical protein
MPVTDQNTLRGVAFMLACTVIYAYHAALPTALPAPQSPIEGTRPR